MLYDIEEDPLEAVDVSASLSEVYRELLGVEEAWFSQDGREPDQELLGHPEVIRQLRSLGYLH
jgi:hypothetical protein